MNSWQIIKTALTKDSRPKTFGYTCKVNEAAELLITLRGYLKDAKESIEAFNHDDEVRDAILSRGEIKEMKDAGIIQ